jgi:hypothetical protein
MNFPFAPSFYFFDQPTPFPGLLSPSPVPFDFVGLLFNNLFVFFEFLISYKLFIILVINLVPCPVFVCGPPGLLATSLLLLGRMGVAFIERRLSLLVLSYLKIVNS